MSVLGNANKLSLVGSETIFIKDMDITGTKLRDVTDNNVTKKENFTVSVDSPKIVVKNADLSDLSCYNVYEQPFGNAKYPVSEIIVDNIKAGSGITHNILSFYTFVDNATVTIKNSSFDLNKNTNVIRFSNLTDAKNVVINLENIDWTYENSGYESADVDWLGLILFQYTNKNGESSDFSSWTINVHNCRYNGIEVTKETAENEKKISYTYPDGIINATVNFI